ISGPAGSTWRRAPGASCSSPRRPAQRAANRPGASVVREPWPGLHQPWAGESGAEMLGRVGKEGDDPRALQRNGELSLVLRARPGLATRLDLRPLRKVAAEAVDLLVVDRVGLVGAERADLAAPSVAVVVVTLLGSSRWHQDL